MVKRTGGRTSCSWFVGRGSRRGGGEIWTGQGLLTAQQEEEGRFVDFLVWDVDMGGPGVAGSGKRVCRARPCRLTALGGQQ